MRRLGAFETAQWLTSEAFSMNVVVVLALDPLPRAEDLQTSLQRAWSRHPMLGVRFATNRRGGHFVADAPCPTVSTLDRRDDRHWRDVVEQELPLGFDNESGPLVRCRRLAARDAPEGELVFTFHHGIVDAVSLSRLFSELFGQDAIADHGSTGPDELPAPSDRRFPPAGRGWRLALAVLRLMGRQVADECRWRWSRPTRNRPRIHAAGSPRITGLELDTATTERLVRACRKRRVTLYGVLSAALMLAVRRHLLGGEHTLWMRHFQFANLRPRLVPPVPPEEIACHFAMLRSAFPVGPRSTLWDLARAVNMRLSESGRNGERYASVVTSRALVRTMLKTRRSRMGETALSYTDPDLIPAAYGKTRVTRSHVFASNMVLGPVYTAQARIFSERLCWDIVYLDSDMDEETAVAVAQEIRNLLTTAPEMA